MNSRPLLDYLAFNDDASGPNASRPAVEQNPVDSLEARLKDLEARLRASQPAAAPKSDLTLSAQIEAILNRKVAPQSPVHDPVRAQSTASRQAAYHDEQRGPRAIMDPPPSVPASGAQPAVDQEFQKFAEAVYLIGQAARRFIEEPQPEPRQTVTSPSTGDIETLSAVLREAVSSFRSVADDLAVSAGEIRHYATRAEREPERQPRSQFDRRHPQPARYRDDDEILELRENIADLQDRLDDLLQARRRTRY